jgi:hypothetical protein
VPEVLGVVGATPDARRLLRAVRGVGALIKDFFGVSMFLLARLLVKLLEDSIVFDEVDGGGMVNFWRLPAAIYG